MASPSGPALPGQPLASFLDKHGIKWQPMRIFIDDRGKKNPAPLRGIMAKSSDFTSIGELEDEELSRRKEFFEDATHLAIDTRDIAQIDVDSTESMNHPMITELLNSTPYFLSCTKKLPHFLVKIEGDNPIKTTIPLSTFGKKDGGQWCVELLCGKWSWADKNVIVQNADYPILIVSKDKIDSWITKKQNKRPRSGDDTRPSGSTELPSETLATGRSTGDVAQNAPKMFNEDLKKKLERYVQGLSKERATEYQTWSEVIFAIMNIAHTHAMLLVPDIPNPALLRWAREQAHEFSRKSDKYDEIGVNAIIDSFKPRSPEEPRLGVSALSRWYHEDRESRDESGDESEYQLDEPKNALTAFGAAMMFIKRQHMNLALCDGEVLWVHDGRWQPLTAAALRNYMTFTHKREIAYGKWSSHAQSVVEMMPSAALSKKGRVLVTLGGRHFKEDVGDRGVGKLAWKNGTYDFATGEFSVTTSENAGLGAVIRDFPAERDADAESDVMNFMRSVFPDEADLDAFMYACARAIAGHVADQRLIVLVGNTSNGKSSLKSFIVRAFPGIAGTFNAANLASTRTDDVDRANTWLLPLEGVRIAFGDELTVNRINGGRVKASTTGSVDTLGVRRLYHETSTTVVTATFVLLLNEYPRIVPTDQAIDKRCYTWEMQSTFVEPGDSRVGQPNVHVASKDLSKQLRKDERLHDALFWLLVDAYKRPAPDFSTIQGRVDRDSNDTSTHIAATSVHIPPEHVDILSVFRFTNDINDTMINSQILKHINSVPGGKIWDMRMLAVRLEILGAKKGNGQKMNKDTKKMERYFTNIAPI